MSLEQELFRYIFQAFPNGSTLLQDIVSKYTSEIVFCAGLGLTAVWEFIYDRLFERNSESIAITAASEKIAEASASAPSRSSGSPPNGYSNADKKILEQILEKATAEERKSQLQQYCTKGTLKDAIEDFEKFSGNTTERKQCLREKITAWKGVNSA